MIEVNTFKDKLGRKRIVEKENQSTNKNQTIILTSILLNDKDIDESTGYEYKLKQGQIPDSIINIAKNFVNNNIKDENDDDIVKIEFAKIY